MKIGAVILAGGKNTRMGQDKANLVLNGQTFLSRIRGELTGFEEVLLSVGKGQCRGNPEGLREVPDLYPDSGPMGGLHAALRACESDALLAVSCDMPLFRGDAAAWLCGWLTGEYDAVAAVSRDGRVHPLCAVYRKSTARVFETCLLTGDCRLRSALEKLRVCRVSLADGGFSDAVMTNVNTSEEYARLLRENSCGAGD